MCKCILLHTSINLSEILLKVLSLPKWSPKFDHKQHNTEL
jgi:hypothetical protein